MNQRKKIAEAISLVKIGTYLGHGAFITDDTKAIDSIEALLEEAEDKVAEKYDKMIPIYEQEARVDELKSLHREIFSDAGAMNESEIDMVLQERIAELTSKDDPQREASERKLRRGR